jgi:alkanesulfonate monooxygenase SsuD/methylene tetrahydromethanopterin reductase-like flavin-dependent oxidoreductase (luciferase family)
MGNQEALEQGVVRKLGAWPELKGPISFGINIPNATGNYYDGTPRYSDVLAMSHAAADTGYEVLWWDDHFSFPDEEEGLRGQWEAWTLMAAVSTQLPDLYLGPMVACTAYRNPGVIAKMTEMIDEISGGKFILGLGAGWQKDEYRQFGIRFEPRVSQFAEALHIIHGLLRDGEVDYQGEFYQANQAKNLPRGPHADGAPILVGSTSPRMLKLLVRYADAWNSGGGTLEDVQAKVDKLDAACEEAGRDPKSVTRTIGHSLDIENGALAISAEDHIEKIKAYQGMGIDHVMIRIKTSTPETIALTEPIIKAIRG